MRTLKICHLKLLNYLILDNHIDLFCVTEMWLCHEEYVSTELLSPPLPLHLYAFMSH